MPQEICTLEKALATIAPCPGLECSFWVEGDGDGHCVLDTVEIEISRRPAVAAHLLSLCRDLDDCRGASESMAERGVRQPRGRRSIFAERRATS
jgi:hypothetical protein